MQLTPECMDLLNRILTPKEEDRITIPEIERHPWCVLMIGRPPDNIRVRLCPCSRDTCLIPCLCCCCMSHFLRWACTAHAPTSSHVVREGSCSST